MALRGKDATVNDSFNLPGNTSYPCLHAVRSALGKKVLLFTAIPRLYCLPTSFPCDAFYKQILCVQPTVCVHFVKSWSVKKIFCSPRYPVIGIR